MKRYIPLVVFILSLVFSANTFSQVQKKDKAIFTIPKSEFWDTIKNSIEEFNKKDEEKQKSFQLDFSGYNIPKSIDEFKKQWYNEPISQGATGTCWCFSTTSFLETEIYRQFQKKIKLSEMYTVYWEYVEKARRFVQDRGKSEFGEGSEANAVTRIWKKYGCMHRTCVGSN